MNREHIILGAGMTGLAAGIATSLPVYEASRLPGGICASYYMEAGHPRRYVSSEAGRPRYRFEYGGGHWIFGGDDEILRFLERYGALRAYERKSAVYLPGKNAFVPYPLQYHLAYLEPELRDRALSELTSTSESGSIRTMEEWVRYQFGPTLNTLFFAPFHERYTAGLWTRIRPQDNYKTPVDQTLVRRGAFEEAPETGYNAIFVYPEDGLDGLALRMARDCDVRYGKRAVSIDLDSRSLHFDDGSSLAYQHILSTIPLDKMITMSGIRLECPADPHSSVLVLNIGAARGMRCPDDHWIYLPDNNAGFHRVGFYSNVDAHFLPDIQDGVERVSLYVERAFLPQDRPADEDVDRYKSDVVRELQEHAFIGDVEVIDATWIETAYTWSWPESTWIDEALHRLEREGITMMGRYGRWHFQGIAASLREGLAAEKPFVGF